MVQIRNTRPNTYQAHAVKKARAVQTYVAYDILTEGWPAGPWAFVLLLGFVAFFGVYYERYRCRNWAREGSFKTVEGVVDNFHREPIGGHGPETFTVGGVFFACSPSNLDRAGFNKTTRGGSPIRPGARVRICYQNGRILRLELFNAPNQNTARDAAMTFLFHVIDHWRPPVMLIGPDRTP
jgi:hypothetical protein